MTWNAKGDKITMLLIRSISTIIHSDMDRFLLLENQVGGIEVPVKSAGTIKIERMIDQHNILDNID